MLTISKIAYTSAMPSAYVIKLDLALESKLRLILEGKGFAFTKPTYTRFQARSATLSCTLYESGKLVIQGKDMDEFIRYTLEPEVLGTFSYGIIDPSPRTGVDESGKGDFFGPLCVAAVFAPENNISKLADMGVKDSKRLGDPTIAVLAEKIAANYEHVVVRINPKRYNTLYEQFGNLNLLLGWAHATAIDELLSKVNCNTVIIDQFAAEHIVENALKRKNRVVQLTQRTKAEEDLVVAAASILARDAFVKGLDALSKAVGIVLPKGASAAVTLVGKQLVSRQGNAILSEVAKLHFRLTEEIIGNT